MNRPEFTREQEEWLTSVVSDWYLSWKDRMTGSPNVHPRPLHKLGWAKDELLQILCGMENPISMEDYLKIMELDPDK